MLRKKDDGDKKQNDGVFGGGDFSGLSSFLNDDTKEIIDNVGKFSSPESTNDDKMSAVFQMMTNPAFSNITSSIFGGGKTEAKPTEQPNENYDETETATQSSGDGIDLDATFNDFMASHNKESNTNEEGYKFSEPSNEARDFFKPVENIAGVEATHKLHKLYDNCYSNGKRR